MRGVYIKGRVLYILLITFGVIVDYFNRLTS